MAEIESNSTRAITKLVGKGLEAAALDHHEDVKSVFKQIIDAVGDLEKVVNETGTQEDLHQIRNHSTKGLRHLRHGETDEVVSHLRPIGDLNAGIEL